MSQYEYLKVACSDGIAEISMDLPPLNVMNNAMMVEFNGVLDTLVDDDGLAAIVIRGLGKAFSAGVDVGDHSADKVAAMIENFHGIFRKLASTDALTISVVQGAALGGGCELACFCDIVLASDRAKFGQPEVQVGVFPPVAAAILPLLVGLHKAIELNALGSIIRADEAKQLGLVQHVYPLDEFEGKVEEYLGSIRQLSRPVVRLAKKATALTARPQILEHLENAEKLYLDDLMKVADAHEGIDAFMNKRAPEWTHA